MIHALADVQSKNIGKDTKIWQFCVVLPEAQIGENCNICSHCFIENDVIIGNNVTIKCGVQIWDGIEIEDNVFIGPNVTFCNDKYPRSKQYPEKFLKTIIKKGASIGANATILPGLTIGENAIIGGGGRYPRYSCKYNLLLQNIPELIILYALYVTFLHFISLFKFYFLESVCFYWHFIHLVDSLHGRGCNAKKY